MGGTPPSAYWRPPSLCALNGLGVLCLGMCYCRFAILLRAPNGVSNEHSCSLDRRTPVFFEDKIVRWTRGGGGGMSANPQILVFALFHEFDGMMAHDGAYKGRIHSAVPYIGRKKLSDDLGLMCLSLCGHRMPQNMLRKMMTVFVVNFVLTIMKIYQSVAHII